MRFTTSQVAAVVGGELVGDDAVIQGATQDSRTVVPGCLFVPVAAERDGHEFIAAAVDAGAAAHLTSGSTGPGPAIRVDDTRAALLDLGSAARASMEGAVVGVTGSVGKTSTKDLAAAVLARTGRSHASPRSYNNEIGVPLTLLNAPDEPASVVVEMGARHEGDVFALCQVARPDVGVITTVAPVHTGVFGSLRAVARTKGELLERLPSGGCAVLNADVPELMRQAGRCRTRSITFGSAGEVRAASVSLDDGLRASFLLESPWGRTEVSLSLAGAHMVDNALAAAAVGLVLDVPLEEVAIGLAEARPAAGRMQIGRSLAGFLVVDDAYNANPTSVEAALVALAGLAGEGRRVAVLGLMAELGAESAEAHREVADLASRLGISVVTVGTDQYGLDPAADPDEALESVLAMGLGEGDAVLVKGSLVAGLQALAGRLLTG